MQVHFTEMQVEYYISQAILLRACTICGIPPRSSPEQPLTTCVISVGYRYIELSDCRCINTFDILNIGLSMYQHSRYIRASPEQLLTTCIIIVGYRISDCRYIKLSDCQYIENFDTPNYRTVDIAKRSTYKNIGYLSKYRAVDTWYISSVVCPL